MTVVEIGVLFENEAKVTPKAGPDPTSPMNSPRSPMGSEQLALHRRLVEGSDPPD